MGTECIVVYFKSLQEKVAYNACTGSEEIIPLYWDYYMAVIVFCVIAAALIVMLVKGVNEEKKKIRRLKGKPRKD
jgi:large-conductance mechanosensitive channel